MRKLKKQVRTICGCLICLVAGCLVSCNSPSDIEQSSLKDIEILNVDAPLKITYDDVVDSVSYIALESENCPIGDIRNIKRDGNRLFVQDRGGLYIFDTSGSFISKVGEKGNAAHEYINMDAVYLDKKNKHVCIVTSPKYKLLTYSYEGDFISVEPLPEDAGMISSVSSLGDGSLIAYNVLSYDVRTRMAEYVLYSFDSDKVEVMPLLKGTEVSSHDAIYPFLYQPMTWLKHELYAISALTNIVYKYTDKGMSPVMCVNVPNMCPPASLLEENKELDFFALRELLMEKGYGLGITGISDVGDDLMLSFSNSKTVVTDGREGVLIDRGVRNGITDDLSLSFFSHGISEDRLGYYEPSFLLRQKETVMEGDHRSLKEIVERLSEEDNPVVFQYHFKKDLMNVLKKCLVKDKE